MEGLAKSSIYPLLNLLSMAMLLEGSAARLNLDLVLREGEVNRLELDLASL
jgi:hypothetical protein